MNFISFNKSLSRSLSKGVFVLLVLLGSINCFGWFNWVNWGKRGDSELDKLKEYTVKIPGFDKNQIKVTYTKVGRELFNAFLSIKEHDMTQVRSILNRNYGSKFYHLYSAYCYGFYVWKRTVDPYKKERVRRAVWNIAMEFSYQNTPKWRNGFVRWTPQVIWTIIAMASLLGGAYSQKHYNTFDTPFELISSLGNNLLRLLRFLVRI